MYGIGHAKLADSKQAAMLAEEKAIVAAVYEASFWATEMLREYQIRGKQTVYHWTFSKKQ